MTAISEGRNSGCPTYNLKFGGWGGVSDDGDDGGCRKSL